MIRIFATFGLVTLLTACAPAPVVEEMILLEPDAPVLLEQAAPVTAKTAPLARTCSTPEDDDDGITGTGCLPE